MDDDKADDSEGRIAGGEGVPTDVGAPKIASASDLPEPSKDAAGRGEQDQHAPVADAGGGGGPPQPPPQNDGGDAVPGDAGTIFYSDVVYVEDNDYPRIDFVRNPNSPALPPALKDFKRQIADVARVLRLLFQSDIPRRDKFFRELATVAYSGACVPYVNMDVGTDNLIELKGYVADEFPTVRDSLWKWNIGLVGGAVFFACLGLCASKFSSNGTWFPPVDVSLSASTATIYALLLIPMGVAFGIFTEFVFRVGDDMTYEQLANINPGRWRPLQRGLNTLIVAVIFAAILAKGVFQVGVANTLLNDFWKTDPALSVAVGFVTGFAFPYVRDIVQQFRPVRRDKET